MSFPMMMSLRYLWAESADGMVYHGRLNLGQMNALSRRGLVRHETGHYTITALGLDTLDNIEANWADHVDAHFTDKGAPWRSRDERHALRTIQEIRSAAITRAADRVARAQHRLDVLMDRHHLLSMEPDFEDDDDGHPRTALAAAKRYARETLNREVG